MVRKKIFFCNLEKNTMTYRSQLSRHVDPVSFKGQYFILNSLKIQPNFNSSRLHKPFVDDRIIFACHPKRKTSLRAKDTAQTSLAISSAGHKQGVIQERSHTVSPYANEFTVVDSIQSVTKLSKTHPKNCVFLQFETAKSFLSISPRMT